MGISPSPVAKAGWGVSDYLMRVGLLRTKLPQSLEPRDEPPFAFGRVMLFRLK